MVFCMIGNAVCHISQLLICIPLASLINLIQILDCGDLINACCTTQTGSSHNGIRHICVSLYHCFQSEGIPFLEPLDEWRAGEVNSELLRVPGVQFHVYIRLAKQDLRTPHMTPPSFTRRVDGGDRIDHLKSLGRGGATVRRLRSLLRTGLLPLSLSPISWRLPVIPSENCCFLLVFVCS